MDTYLIVIRVNGKRFLMLSQDGGLQAYRTLDEARQPFSSFIDKWKSSHYETSTSATIGMMQINPIIIATKEATDVSPFLLSNKQTVMHGGTVPMHDMRFVEVSDDIETLKVLDVFSDTFQTAMQGNV